MDTNSQKTTQGTADQRKLFYAKLSHVERVLALGEISPSLTTQQIFDAALTIGLRHLEGGEE